MIKQRRCLRDADLFGIDFTNIDLTGADLTGADLTGADLTGANLTGADLTDANLTGAILYRAEYNADTRWPDGFDPNTAGAVECRPA